jgi:hypothetical protein
MDHAVLVRIGKRREELGDGLHRIGERQARARFQAARELLAAHQVHDDVRRALVHAVVEDRDDVGMRELAGRVRLALEARTHVGELIGRRTRRCAAPSPRPRAR